MDERKEKKFVFARDFGIEPFRGINQIYQEELDNLYRSYIKSLRKASETFCNRPPAFMCPLWRTLGQNWLVSLEVFNFLMDVSEQPKVCLMCGEIH